MNYITMIKMKPGCYNSKQLVEIDKVFISGSGPLQGYYKKEQIYDYLQINPRTILVNIPPYPCVIPDRSQRGEKYIRSSPNGNLFDNLLRLPREY